MKFGTGVAGAVVGGLVGAAAWAAISHFFQYEIGWIASITGALVGFGFKVGYPSGGTIAGVLAAVLAVVAVTFGKVAALTLDHQAWVSAWDVNADREVLISFLAEDVVETKRLAGETLVWPPMGRTIERVGKRDYPKDVWEEAERLWGKMSPQQQEVFAQEPRAPVVDDILVSLIADEVMERWLDEGRDVGWPEGALPFMESRESWFPADVWDEAEAEWMQLPENEKESRRNACLDQSVPLSDSVRVAISVLPQTLSPFDALWVLLGVAAAFNIARGDEDDAAGLAA